MIPLSQLSLNQQALVKKLFQTVPSMHLIVHCVQIGSSFQNLAIASWSVFIGFLVIEDTMQRTRVTSFLQVMSKIHFDIPIPN